MFKYGIYLTQGQHPENSQYYYALKEPLLVALAHGEADLQNTVQTCAAEWLANVIKDYNDHKLDTFWNGTKSDLEVLKTKIGAIEPFDWNKIEQMTEEEESANEVNYDLEHDYRKEEIAQTMISEQLAKFNIEAFLMVKEINVEKAYVLVSIPFGYNDEWNYSYQGFTEKAGVFLDYEEVIQYKKSRTIENFEWFFADFLYGLEQELDPEQVNEYTQRIQNGMFTADYVAENVDLEMIEFFTVDIQEKYILDEAVYHSFLIEAFAFGVLTVQKADLKESQDRLYDYLKDYFYTVHPY